MHFAKLRNIFLGVAVHRDSRRRDWPDIVGHTQPELLLQGQ